MLPWHRPGAERHLNAAERGRTDQFDFETRDTALIGPCCSRPVPKSILCDWFHHAARF